MFMYASASRDKTCISPIIPAQPTAILSVILKTFFDALLITKVPYEYRRSEARIAPSLQTSPSVVAPGTYMSSLNFGSQFDRRTFCYKATAGSDLRGKLSGLNWNMVAYPLFSQSEPCGAVRLAPIYWS